MKKKFKYFYEVKNILLIVGVILIWIGIVISVNNYMLHPKQPKKEKIIVNTETKSGDIIENNNYKEHVITKKYEEYSFRNKNTNSKKQYVVLYPNKLTRKTLSDSDMIVGNNEISIKGMCSHSKSFDEYQEKIISLYKNKKDAKYNVSISNKKSKIDEYEVSYLKIEALEKSINDNGTTEDLYSEKFFVLIKESDTTICEISYQIYEQKFTDEMLTDFINNIKIKENEANFLYTTTNGEMIEGVLLQKDLKNIKKQYSLSYQISNEKYQEIENDQNDLNSHTFKMKNNSLIINISLKSMLSTETFIEDYMKSLTSNINNNEGLIIKDISYEINSYNNKDYYEINLIYHNEIENLSTNLKYLITKLEENIYYIIKIENEDIISDVNNIKEFFSFEFN